MDSVKADLVIDYWNGGATAHLCQNCMRNDPDSFARIPLKKGVRDKEVK